MAAQVCCVEKQTFWQLTHLDEGDEHALLAATRGLAMRDRCHSDVALQLRRPLLPDSEDFACKAGDVDSCDSTDDDGSASSAGEPDLAEPCDAECSRSSALCWASEMDGEDHRQHESEEPNQQACSLVAQLRQNSKRSEASNCRPVRRNIAPRTTLILRNVPKSFTRAKLLDVLNREGFSCDYCLVYLPIDFVSAKTLGYALVDFVSEAAAERAMLRFQGFAWATKSKPCEVAWSQMNQGFESHVDRYRNSALMHPSVPDDCKPAIFSEGQRLPFPAPTRQVPMLRRGLVASNR